MDDNGTKATKRHYSEQENYEARGWQARPTTTNKGGRNKEYNLPKVSSTGGALY